MTAVQQYFEDVARRMSRLALDESGAIEATAQAFVGAIREARPIHIYDSGHLIAHEFIARTGGLAAFSLLTVAADIDRGNEWIASQRKPTAEQAQASTRELVGWILGQGTIRGGDVLVVSSVSGTNGFVVELAARAREAGVIVVAVTGVDFSKRLVSSHPSGSRLFDVADIVLDNQVPYGDAALPVDGLDVAVAPWSGLSGVSLLWAATVRAVELSIAGGVLPTVYTSYNLPDGAAAYAEARARYRESGR